VYKIIGSGPKRKWKRKTKTEKLAHRFAHLPAVRQGVEG